MILQDLLLDKRLEILKDKNKTSQKFANYNIKRSEYVINNLNEIIVMFDRFKTVEPLKNDGRIKIKDTERETWGTSVECVSIYPNDKVKETLDILEYSDCEIAGFEVEFNYHYTDVEEDFFEYIVALTMLLTNYLTVLNKEDVSQHLIIKEINNKKSSIKEIELHNKRSFTVQTSVMLLIVMPIVILLMQNVIPLYPSLGIIVLNTFICLIVGYAVNKNIENKFDLIKKKLVLECLKDKPQLSNILKNLNQNDLDYIYSYL